MARHAGGIADVLLAHDGLHAIRTNQGLAPVRHAMLVVHGDGVTGLLHALDARAGQCLDVAVRFGPFQQRGVDVRAVDHGVRVAKALAKSLARGDAADQVFVQRVMHHHFVGVDRAGPRQLANAQGVERGKSVGAQLDARADLAELRSLLQHLDRIALARQGQGCCHATDASASDQDGCCGSVQNCHCRCLHPLCH